MWFGPAGYVQLYRPDEAPLGADGGAPVSSHQLNVCVRTCFPAATTLRLKGRRFCFGTGAGYLLPGVTWLTQMCWSLPDRLF